MPEGPRAPCHRSKPRASAKALCLASGESLHARGVQRQLLLASGVSTEVLWKGRCTSSSPNGATPGAAKGVRVTGKFALGKPL